MGRKAELRGLGVPQIVLEDLAVAGSNDQSGPVLLKVNAGEWILALDRHQDLPGGGVTADQLLVQAHGQREAVVDGTEGDGGGRGDVGGEAEQELVRVAVPE